MNPAGRLLEERLRQLETHLEQENPVLLKTVQSFRQLDRVARRMGLLDRGESFATQIPWWPMISVLGTFSSGKSTFINHFLDFDLQRTGNQAVDDRFTVICYSHAETAHALPGVALDSDPRFPFYQISTDLEEVAEGEGRRIDAYLQLKTCPSEKLRGKILIDSPGFDADAQRTSTLRITDHMIDLSDLVLVFFDARHPEPGAMRDTLVHLVSDTIHRADSGKFLYILNQIDTTAREDNPEDVVAAWQRALGEKGLTAGRFYTIYNPDAAFPIEDPDLRARYERKRDADLSEIHGRMQQVEVERAYRIVGALEKTARDIEERTAPLLSEQIARWRRRVVWGDLLFFPPVVVALVVLSLRAGYWDGLRFNPPWLGTLIDNPILGGVVLFLVLFAIGAAHVGIRRLAARGIIKQLGKEKALLRGDLAKAFIKTTGPWRSIFSKSPAGWGGGARKRIRQVLEDTDRYVQTLNDSFTNPSGEDLAAVQVEPPGEHRPAFQAPAEQRHTQSERVSS